MNSHIMILIVFAVLGLLFTPNRFRRGRRHGYGYLIGLVILTVLVFVVMRFVYGFYVDAMGG